MAAYAALLSLDQTIHQIKHHPHPPISLDDKQFQSLSRYINSFQNFLENPDSFRKDGLDLEARIAKAAYTAENNIESHVLFRIRLGDTREKREKIAADCNGILQRILEDMDSINEKVMQSTEVNQLKTGEEAQHQTPEKKSPTAPPRKNDGPSTAVGLDDVLIELLEKVVRGQPHRQVIPVTGMSGIGKTTLARNIYQHRTVVGHFDFLAWVSISQEYTMTKILRDLLHGDNHHHYQEDLHHKKDENLPDGDNHHHQEDLHHKKDENLPDGEESEKVDKDDESEVGLKLYKKLYGMRYLVVVDDIWDIKGWDKLKRYLPDNNKGSRVVVTTRLSNLANDISNSPGIEMHFLDKLSSWSLFCKIVFRGAECPPELENIGMEIVQGCKGLPLSIVVIGGVLVDRSKKYWEDTAKNVNEIVNLDDDKRCHRILYMSYNSLPVYLKPCFLYLGVFKEDREIPASALAKLWVAEGILKPESGKTLEEVALECLEQLVVRNLILVERRNHRGKLKVCKIHDLLRDLCLREARDEKFLCVPTSENLAILQDLEGGRRVSLCEVVKEEEYNHYPNGVVEGLVGSMSVRSLISAPYLPEEGLLFLRVYSTEDLSCGRLLDDLQWRVNFRYVNVRRAGAALYFSQPIYSRLWNLQTLILRYRDGVHAPSEFWRMSQLRHVQITPSVKLPDDDDDDGDVPALENLQTLSTVENFKWEGRVPNIKKLKIASVSQDCCRLGSLQKLTSLSLFAMEMRNPSFPNSLEKLVLFGGRLGWEEMGRAVGSLPGLRVLKLRKDACVGKAWQTVEGQFVSLVHLEIDSCDVEEWESDESSHFPSLERVVLRGLKKLEEVPSSLGDVATLELIWLENCSRSAWESGRRILKEQEEYGNEGLQVLCPTFYEEE